MGEAPAVDSRWRGPARAVATLVVYLLVEIVCMGAAFMLGAPEAGASIVGLVGGLLVLVWATQTWFGTEGPAAMRRDLGLVATTGRNAALGLGVGVLLVLVWYLLITMVLPPEWGAPSHKLEEIARASTAGLLAFALMAVVLAPLSEELLFRGAMLHGFMQRWSGGVSVALTALLFAALHIGPAQPYWPGVVNVAVIGVVLALLRIRTGSLLPGVIAHAVYNSVAVLDILV